MPRIHSAINPRSAEYAENQAAMQTLVDEPNQRLASGHAISGAVAAGRLGDV